MIGTVMVTGANRGIGLEFVRQYAEQGWRVLACCRHPGASDDLQTITTDREVQIYTLDVSNFEAIDELADRLRAEPVDVLINNAGVFGPKVFADDDPRQTFGHMDYEIWEQVLRTNLMAPLKMVESFLEHVRIGQQKKIVNLSSSVASIAETATGIYSYRSSKTGLNVIMATLANEVRDQGISVGIYCPGWVQTRMGGPQASVTPTDSVAGLRARIDELNPDNSGRFLRYNGEVIPW